MTDTEAAPKRRRRAPRKPADAAILAELGAIAAMGGEGTPVRPRRRRTPLNAHQTRLALHGKHPDYSYRWFLDRDDRIADAYANDWDFVTRGTNGVQAISDDPGTQLSQVANKSSGGQRLYVMAKPKAYFEEDQREKQARLNAVDEAIFRNMRASHASAQQTLPTAQEDSAGHFYLPTTTPRHMVKGG